MVATGGADAVPYSANNSLGEPRTSVVTDRRPARILLVGGTAALASSIEAELALAAPNAAVDRLGGATRIETAALSAERAFTDGASVAVIANGWSLHDVSVAAAFAAARDDTAVLYAQEDMLTPATANIVDAHEPAQAVLIGGTDELSTAIVTELRREAPAATVQRISDSTRLGVAAQAARQVLSGGVSLTPGDGVEVTMGRANWSTGYFQAELYRQLLTELGYNVSDPGCHATVGRPGEGI